MAHLFATDLSLGLPDYSKQADDTEDEVAKPELRRWPEMTAAATGDDVIVKETGSWPHYARERGKRNHPTGLVDYLGDLPVLETHLPAQGLSNVEAKSLLSSLCCVAPVMIPRADLSYMPSSPPASHARCIPASLSAQLTLFYAGTVNVYDNVPADKAQIIMSLAGSGNPWPLKELNSPSMQALNTPGVAGVVTSSFKRLVAPSPQLPVPCSLRAHHLLQKIQSSMQGSPLTATNLSAGDRFQVPEDGQTQELSSLLVPCQAVVPTALPLARKASLARFLEKRKERIRSMAPYSVKENCQDISPTRFYNGFLGSHGEEKLGSNSRFLDNDGIAFEMDVEDQNWITIAENSKQVSESASTT